MGGGNVTLFASHMIDLIYYLSSQKAVRLHAVCKIFTTSTSTINGTRSISSPDFSSIQMEMDGGMFVSMTLSNHLPKGHFFQEILFKSEKGYIKAEGATIKGLLYNNNANKEGTTEKEVMLFEDSPDTDLLLVDRNARNSSSVFSPLLPPIYMAGLLKLLGSLRETFNMPNGKEWKKESSVGLIGSGFEDGLYIQAVIEAIRKSSKESVWVKVSVITEEPDPNPGFTATVRTSTISI